MLWSRDLPITWSRHMITHIIWSHVPDTPTNFIKHQSIINFNIRITLPMLWLCPSLLHHQSTRLHPIVDFEQVLGVFTSRSQWWWRERGLPRSLSMKATGGLPSRSTPIQNPVVVLWKGFTLIAINKSHWWEPRWVVSSMASWTQLARPSRTSTSASTIHHTTRWVGVTAE